MKKLLTTLVFLAFSTISANAVDLSSLSLTGGMASNMSVFGASATETGSDESGTVRDHDKEHGVFTEDFSSTFLELGLGSWLSVGYEHTPDSLSTPTNTSSEGDDANTVSVDFNDFDTTYLKINIPGGMYLKYGTVSTDLDIKETMNSGNTYANVSVDGTSTGLGYQRYIGDSGFGFRFEANYIDLDNASTNNGVATTGNHNKIDTSNMEGATAKLALTYTFGRD
mgnify:CR=1 FL=1